MPDKVQNIVINYDFKTDKVVAAKASLQQAQTVADKFESSAIKSGRAAEQSYSSATRSIVVMKQELERLKFRIENTSGADKKRLADLSAQYKKLDADIRKTTDSLLKQEQAVKANAKSTRSLAENFGGLYNTIKAVIAAGLVREVINTTLEMAKLAGNVEGVERAFKRAFPNAALTLDELRTATHGAVSDFELMQRTLQATNLGVSVEHLGTLFEFAAARAQQTGESVDYLVDSIVRGIGRKSILVLDNLGLSATRLKEQFNGASLASQSVADVTKGVAAIAQVELDKMGGFAETSATKVDQLTVAWKELRVELSKDVTQEGGFIDMLNDAVEAARLVLAGGGNAAKAIRIEEIQNQALELVKLFKTGLGEDAAKNIEDVQQKLNSTVQTIGRYNDEIKKVQETIALGEGFGFPGFSEENQAGAKRYTELVQQYGNRAKEVFEKEIADARKRLLAWNLNKQVLEASIPLLKTYLQTLQTGSKEVVDQLGLIAEKEEQIQDLGEKLKAAKSTQEIERLTDELEKLNGELADLKAFGTTKQFIEVDGKVRLVPVTAGEMKKYKLDLTNKFGELEVHIKAVMDVVKPDSNRIFGDARGNFSARMGLQPVGSAQPPTPQYTPTQWDLIADEFEKNWRDIVSSGIDSTSQLINAAVQAEADAYEQRINQARDYYDSLIGLAGDNEREKERLSIKAQAMEKRLRREAFEADKRAKRSSAIINGAAGIVNAFATLPYPAAIVAALLIAAETATQVAVINKQQPRFAKGVIDLKGPGTGTSDSINAKLSKGESVMTAEETRNSMGVLKAVRAKTLNDKVLADFKLSGEGVKYVGMDDKRIISKLDEIKYAQTDYAEKFGILYKTRKRTKNLKQWVQTRAMG